MQAIFEVLFESAIDAILEKWPSIIQKRFPNLHPNRKLFVFFTALFVMLFVLIVFIAILTLIEWLLPNLFDFIRFD